MSRTLCFLDAEFTGLDPDRHEIWELAMHRVPEVGDASWHCWQFPVDLSVADPLSLRIGGFHDRRWSPYRRHLRGQRGRRQRKGADGLKIYRHSSREGTRGIRSFLYVYDRQDRRLLEGAFEGYVASGADHTGFELCGDDDSSGLQVFVGARKVACVWVTVGVPALQRWLYRRGVAGWWGDLEVVNVRFHDRAVWWSFWHDKWSWSSRTPQWRKGSFHWWRWITGKPVHTSEIVQGPVEVTIPMPEGGYRATVTIERNTWTRPRWPWPQISHNYNVRILSRPGPDGPYVPEDGSDGYIPKPGKGENPWDCGPDGTFGMSGPGRTVEKAIGEVVASTLATRRRRGASYDYAEPIGDS